MPGKDTLLSVCCLGYRDAPYIRDCITTIWQDSWPNIEIVAMDDGSKDGSLEILKELEGESPCPFTVLEQENTGNVPANFNRLLKAAHGDFVLFTALDDMQIPGALEARMERLLANEHSVFAAHTKAFVLEDNKKLQPRILFFTDSSKATAPMPELEPAQVYSFPIQSAVFRRSALGAINGFSGTMLGSDCFPRTTLIFHIFAHPTFTFSLIDAPGFICRRHRKNSPKKVEGKMDLTIQYKDGLCLADPAMC